MTGSVIFDPLLEWPFVWAALIFSAAFIAFAAWRKMAGWWLRGLAALILVVALFNPSLQQEDRAPLSDIVILVVDESASQRIADRPDQTARAIAEVEAEIATLPNTELRVVPMASVSAVISKVP